MSTATLPEAVRTDLTIRRDLRPDDVRGFLTDLWREPDGHDAALIFADWLEDQGDARTQPVRWSVLRENCYTEQIRDAYRSRLTDWWLRHGRAWVQFVGTIRADIRNTRRIHEAVLNGQWITCVFPVS